jgi:protein ImuB
MRLACLHVPEFPLAAWYRAEPALRGTAVVVADGEGPRARLVACAPAAAAFGIAPGLSAAQAQAIASAVVVRVASADAARAAHAALADVAYSFSPRVEDGAPGTVYVDADGLSALFADERALAQAMAQRAAALGLEAQVGIAGSKIAAELAARDGGGVMVVAPHAEWQLLAPLSIDRLAPDPQLRATLQRWGVRTLGALAALPASALATRLGPEAAALARRARGEDATPLAPRPLPLDFEESAQLDWGVDALEPFLFVVRGLLDRLIARLEIRGLVCGDLRLSLGLADRGRDERTVTVAAPSNATKPLLTLLRVHLETHPPRAAVESVRLAAVPERLRAAQLDLFRPAGPAPAQLAATLARLNALCGDATRVAAPGLADSHRPEAYAVQPLVTDGRSAQPPPGDDQRRIALRAIRPPLALEVFCRRDQPDFIRPAVATTPLACSGRVVALAGPWRLHGEWWTAATLHRDYYDAQLTDGGVYRVYFDRQVQRWFLDGSYD